MMREEEDRGKERGTEEESCRPKKIFFFWSFHPSFLLLEREHAEMEVYKVPFREVAVMKKEPESTFW